MKARTAELAVGLFVIFFAIALFLLAMRVSGLVGNNFGDSYTLTAKFDNISGLKERAKVTIAGVKVGQVKSIQFDPVSNKALVTLSMDKKLSTFTPEQLKETEKFALENLHYLPEYQNADENSKKAQDAELLKGFKNSTVIDQDAYLKVATNGIIGEKYLKIEMGGSYKYIPQGGSFADTQTQGTMEIEDLINKFIGGQTGMDGKSSTSQAKDDTAAKAENNADKQETAASSQANPDEALFDQ